MTPEERRKKIEELEKQYSASQLKMTRWGHLRKKYVWLLVVRGTRFLKRVIDFFGSIILLFLSSPLFVLIATVIKLQDLGPVFYISTRVGKWGKEFSFPKFRTMRVDADLIFETVLEHNLDSDSKKFKMKRDPRVTIVGRYLRKLSLDELPQLWSVFIGHMSLVGPRPPLPREVEKYSLGERRRLDIKPGITGMWQVSGRSDIEFNEQMQLDIAYINSQSIWGDIIILLKTIPAVFFGRGAY